MEIWLIAVIVAGGVIVLALLALIIYRCCCRRKGKNNKRDAKGQNGHVWQAHDKDVELADEEDPQSKMKEDGLCKETEAGSTFPRRIKAEDPNPEPQREDGLCEDTEKRFTYPRRGKPENEHLLPTDKNNLSTSETAIKSAVPIGFVFEGKETQDKLSTKTEVQVHRSKHDTPKDKGKDKESSSDSSSDSDIDEKQRNGAQHLIKHSDKRGRKAKRAKSFVERKRSKSLHNSLGEIPEYSKPIKRSVSNPSFVARERMIQKDARFQSLETWRSTIPIPQRDYPKDISSARLHEEDDQDNAPPSYATSDSGVECLDALSGHDDESINHCDSVPESPGLPSQLKDETSFSSFKETSYKERTEMRYQESKHIMNSADHGINGFQGNAVVMTTKDHTALIDANAVKDSPSPFGVNQQGIFFQSTPTENKPRDVSSPYRDPKLALRSTPSPSSNSVSSSERKPTERKPLQTKDAEQMDFRSVKLRPTSTNYDQSHTFMIYGSSHGYTGVKPSSEKEKEHHITAEQQRPKNQDSGQTIVIDNATDGPKDHYILPGSKTPAIHTEKTQIHSPDTDTPTDFQRVHLRHVQAPQSHIASREEMETQTRDKTEEESETVIGVHDGIKRFQSQGAQVPKPMFGSHYVYKKDPSQKPVSIISKEPAPNSKPVSIVTPEPSVMDRETHTTTTTTSRNVREVKANQNGNVPTIINKNERTRPVSVINESVVSEDRRHFRYSTGIVNQNHVSLGFKDAQQKTFTVIRGSDEDEKTNTTSNKQDSVLEKRHFRYSTGNDDQSHVSLGFKDVPQKTITVIRGSDEDVNTKTTSNKQDSLEKPVSVVTPQSPKAKRESSEERAAFEEERKKNWKREQIEQKLTSVHMRSVQNKNEQVLQASGLALRSVMPELFTKIKQIGEEKEEAPVQ